MSNYVCNGALLKCSQGLAPSSLVVIRPTINASKNCMANMMDFVPLSNIMPFGMCNTEANPTVAAATAAASGVHTPAPCIPNTIMPWMGCKGNVMVQKMPALTKDGKLMCLWTGQIEVAFEGQVTVKEG